MEFFEEHGKWYVRISKLHIVMGYFNSKEEAQQMAIEYLLGAPSSEFNYSKVHIAPPGSL